MEIKPGFELDQAVAEAIGLDAEVRVRKSYAYGVSVGENKPRVFISGKDWAQMLCSVTSHDSVSDGGGIDMEFEPSMELWMAFAAAEKVGLFSGTFWRVLGMDELGETWGVFDEGAFGEHGIAKVANSGDQHETPALAICAAILTMKETTVTAKKED